MDDGGPAFPSNTLKERGMAGDIPYSKNPGMSLRDWFAGMVLSQVLQASASDASYDYVAAAVGAYELADAMLAERESDV